MGGDRRAGRAGAPLRFRVEVLHRQNEVAALKGEVRTVAEGEGCLLFDTAKGLMAIVPASPTRDVEGAGMARWQW
ncbi:hypothetical protein [Roseomonas mucosa]|uniref:hypothetical protein n=1 Tax=Roseomonas mucosa TaxID=207340 RepID=UPI002246C9D6|nr:hypothetical protein [Roseomonas mucosa]